MQHLTCKGNLRADAKSARALCFGAMIHTKVDYSYIQKSRTDSQTTLTSVEQHMSLELNRQQARGQPSSQSCFLVRGLIENGLFLRQAWEHAEAASDMKTKEWTASTLDGGQSAKIAYLMRTSIDHSVMA